MRFVYFNLCLLQICTLFFHAPVEDNKCEIGFFLCGVISSVEVFVCVNFEDWKTRKCEAADVFDVN